MHVIYHTMTHKVFSSPSLPPQLLRALDERRCVLFFGAGASLNAKLPSSKELANKLANELLRDFEHDSDFSNKKQEVERCADDLKRTAQLYNGYNSDNWAAHHYVADEIAARELDADLSVLHPLRNLPTIKEIFTTNYDLLIENVLGPNECQVIYKESDLRQRRGPKVKLVKLHGTRTDAESLILTDDDYHKYPHKHVALVELTKTALREKMFVLIGYGMEDTNFGEIFKTVSKNADGEALHYFVAPDRTLYQSLHWTKQGFHHIEMTAEQFLQALAHNYSSRHYSEQTASFSEPDRKPSPVEPLHNPFVLFDTEALIEEKPEFLFETFIKPVDFPKILEHRHTFIEGHRGSGKSTVLWRLSLKSRAYDNSFDLPMWGFYVKMVPGYFNAFRREQNADRKWTESDNEWSKYFIHYFNLILLSGVLRHLDEAIEEGVLKCNDKLKNSISEIAHRLVRLRDLDHVNDIRSLQRRIEEEIDSLQNDRRSAPHYTGATLLSRSLEILTDSIPRLREKWWHILLDEYDNVDKEQQSVINVMLRERHRKMRFKIAVKTLHAYLIDIDGKSLDTTDDFGYVPCDSFVQDQSQSLKQEYFEFLEKLANKRLQQAGYKDVEIRELLPEEDRKAKAATGEARKRGRGKGTTRSGNTDLDTYYAGFETYCYLSSGLTRQFLELCKDAIYFAYPDSAYTHVELKPIPMSSQHHVAKVHSAILFKHYRSTTHPQRVYRLFKVLGPLFRAIAKATATQAEYRNPLSFQIVDLDQLSEESSDMLLEAVGARLLQFPVIPKAPHNPLKDGPAQKYSFHRLLAPIFSLSPRERYDVPLSANFVNEIWRDPDGAFKALVRASRVKGLTKQVEDEGPLFKML